MATINETAAQIMEHLCNHDWHGYTQGNRWGDGGTETVTVDGKGYTIATGDRDCSSAIISAYKAALIGTEHEGALDGATYTGNMRSVFTRSGLFDWQPMSYIAQRGDVYLNERDHTAMCTSAVPDVLAEFSISENGTIYGNVGDQTGHESSIHGYYDYPWNGILRWIGSGEAAGNPAPAPAPSGIPDLRYRVRTGGVWLPEMINHMDTGGSGDSYAGNGGPLEYLAIDMTGWYQVRTQANGWLDPVRGYNINDLEYGCAGDGSPITGVRCYYETQDPAATGWLAIEYAVANVGGDFFADMRDTYDTGGSGDDYAGNGGAISAFRARLVRA